MLGTQSAYCQAFAGVSLTRVPLGKNPERRAVFYGLRSRVRGGSFEPGSHFGIFACVCVNGGVLGSFGANCRVSNVFFGFIFWLREIWHIERGYGDLEGGDWSLESAERVHRV